MVHRERPLLMRSPIRLTPNKVPNVQVVFSFDVGGPEGWNWYSN